MHDDYGLPSVCSDYSDGLQDVESFEVEEDTTK